MASIAEDYQFVVGVDTHAKDHHYAIVAAGTGAVVAGPERFAATAAGYGKAIAWIGRATDGGSVLAAIEGTNSYGRALARAITKTATMTGTAAMTVTEARPPAKAVRRGRGKTDGLDAVRAARSVLERDRGELIVPRQGQDRTDLQVLLIVRGQLTREKTARINVLGALVRSLGLLADTRKKLTMAQIRALAAGRLVPDGEYSPIVAEQATTVAASIVAREQELLVNKRQLRTIVAAWRPDLLEMVGVGPIVAARILTVWSHHGRFADNGRFASIAGASPVPIGSGQTLNWRLNYGGDRQLNSALHTIMLIRKRRDQRTKDYIAKRTADGKTPRAINRLLKRYIAREVFKLLEHHDSLDTTAPSSTKIATAA